MNHLLQLVLLMFYFFSTLVCAQTSVLLLNPGKTNESFWGDVDMFADAAAKRLELQLTVFHAERDPYLMIKHIEDLIAQQRLPDYLLLVNEKQVLPKILYLLEGKPVFIMVILNGLNEQEQSRFNQNQHWQKYLLSSLIPNNYWIGAATAEAMLTASNGQAGDVVIISGDKTTPASLAREAGARDFFNAQAHLNLKQIVYGNWEEQLSYQKSNVLLARYPKLKYIWTANDHMAFGSLRAIHARGLQPGKNVFVSTINTSDKVLKLRASGEISALGGGHFAAAGWALVMINNHLNGYMLPKHVREPLFQLIEPDSTFYQYLQAKDWAKLPFETLIPDKHGAISFEFKK